MNLTSPLLELSGVIGYAVSDSSGASGAVVRVQLAESKGDQLARTLMGMAVALSATSEMLGLGSTRIVTAKGATTSWVCAFHGEQAIGVELACGVSTSAVEAHLQKDEWSVPVELSISDSDIEYVTPEQPVANRPAAKPAMQTTVDGAGHRVFPIRGTTTAPGEGGGPVPVAAVLERGAAERAPAGGSAAIPNGGQRVRPATISRGPVPNPTRAEVQSPSNAAAVRGSVEPSTGVAAPGPVNKTPGAASHVQHERVSVNHDAQVAAAATPRESLLGAQVTPHSNASAISMPAAQKSMPVAAMGPKPMSSFQETKSIPPAKPSLKPSLFIANARGLRRALVRGDINEARAIAEQLKDSVSPDNDLCGSGTSARAIDPLLGGIAATLSGDLAVALEPLRTLAEDSSNGPSLQWAAMIWLARAHAALTTGLDAAITWAEQAGHLSKQLDVESRTVSARIVAEICLYRKDWDHAARFVEQARKLSESLADRDESSEILILQAKILLVRGDRTQAVSVAERAHALRVDWSPPILLLAQCAFATGNVDRVVTLLRPFEHASERPGEIARLANVLAAVVRQRVSPAAAAEFLELVEQPPSKSVLERLEKLASSCPDNDDMWDALGWRLLRTGHTERAAAIFHNLSQRTNLSNEVRASVMLGLSFLVANRGDHYNSAAKIVASVSAAPKHLQVEKEPSYSSGHIRAARPVDVANLEPLSTNTPPTTVSTRPGPGPRTAPTFSGNLNHFSLPDVLEFLRAGRSSGTLLCSSVRGVGAVHLTKGFITGAAAPCTMTLRDLLISRASLTEERANKAVEMQKAGKPVVPIGTLLVRNGWCSKEDVADCLRVQIKLAMSELMKWGDGQFAFDPEATVTAQAGEIELAVDPQALILDIFREMDESAKEIG